jgi:acetyl-CoA synthetase (ADP-forming)
VISQSGTVFAALACWAAEDGIGVSKLVALGNKRDVNEIELLEFLANDPETEVIALYIEGTKDGRKFVKIAREASDRKPVIVLKGGRTEKGAKAVASHTRSLAGVDIIFDAAFKQARTIRVNGVEDLYDACKGFACLPRPKGDGVVIVTSSGGSGILATDACEGLGLKLVDFPDEVRNILREKLPPACILRNPLDLTGSATSQMYDDSLTALGAAPEVHSVIVIVGDPMPGITEVISKHFGRGKVIVPVMLGGGEAEVAERKKLQELHIPVYPSPLRGARSLAILTRYTKLKG